MRRLPTAKSEYIKMLDSNGDLHPLVDLTIKDIFRRLDKIIINNSLEYGEFKEFYSRLSL
jgi:hypothetical protein